MVLALSLLHSLVLVTSASTAPAGGGCGTVVPPGPVVDSAWTLAGSPYCITGDVEVGPLTIEAGVEVRVDGAYRIEVVAPLVIDGTCREPVVIGPATAGTTWKGFRLDGIAPGSTFRHAVVSGADDSAFTLVEIDGPTFEHCVLHDNASRTQAGGAIRAVNVTGELTLLGCAFSDNVANSGGALHLVQSALAALDSSFTGNSVSRIHLPYLDPYVGGAISQLGGDATIERCTFRDNSAQAFYLDGLGGGGSPVARGGAIHFDGNGIRAVSGSFFVDNTTDSSSSTLFCSPGLRASGGGIHKQAGTLLLTNDLFAGNRCSARTLMNTTCEPNDVRFDGSAVSVVGGSTLDHCTVVRNPLGSAIQGGASVHVENSIVAFNDSEPEGSGIQVSAGVQVNWSCVPGGAPGTGNLDADPLLVGVGTEVEDLRLVEGSPCVDVGDPDPLHDDACYPPARGGARSDMGAFGGPGNCAWGCAVSARAVTRNGSGGNDEILRSLSTPVPGRCWTVELDCTGSTPSVAYLQVKRFPTSGVFMLGQEVLIAGPQFLAQQRVHEGDAVLFTGPVPSAAVLCGFTVSAQGACFGGAFRLSNALDLTLGR